MTSDVLRLEAPADRGARALWFATQYGQHEGEHHKAWVIDQVVRALTGCPLVEQTKMGARGQPYTFERQGESEEYLALIALHRDGDDGPETYSWEIGVPP